MEGTARLPAAVTKGSAEEEHCSQVHCRGTAGVIQVDLGYTDILNHHHVLPGTRRKLKPRERIFLFHWQSQTDDAVVEISPVACSDRSLCR